MYTFKILLPLFSYTLHFLENVTSVQIEEEFLENVTSVQTEEKLFGTLLRVVYQQLLFTKQS